jgi:uncharacterized protein
MTMRLQRPVLVGGIALSVGLLGLDTLHHVIGDLGDWVTVGAIAAGSGYWWYSKQKGSRNRLESADLPLSREKLDRSINQVKLILDRLIAENNDPTQISQFQERLQQAIVNLERTDRHISVTGAHRVGKSTLIELLKSQSLPIEQQVKYTETPALFSVGEGSASDEITAQTQNLAADLVLFLVNGDLTATEYKYLQQLDRADQETILLVNQIDRYLPQEQEIILQKLKTTLGDTIDPANIVSASTAPAAIKVRHLAADGATTETSETPAPNIEKLTSQLSTRLSEAGEQLLWGSTSRQLGTVETEAKAALNTHRRNLAQPLIEQSQWIVGAAAFANPVPALDLLATAAVNAQMIMDLGKIYQQKFTLEQAETAGAAMGDLMLKLGIVELCTQTVANLLKTNAITFVAGGLVQGLSAAYLTRIVGLTLVEYLEAQDLLTPEPPRAWNLGLLGKTLQSVFKANERVAYVQTIVKQGVERLLPKDSSKSEQF